jgi:hypothetical protein
VESYSLANLITDCEAGASTASDSFDECAPRPDAADDGGRDLLLEFTSECELEVEAPAVDGAVDAPTVDDAPVPVYVETAFAPLSVPVIVVSAPAIPPVTVRSRLTTDWQMQAARAAVVVRRRTWTIPRPWQAAFSGSRLALPILPFVYGVIFGGVTVLLATGQLHDRTATSPGTSRPSSTQSSTASVVDAAPSISEPSVSDPVRQGYRGQAPRSAPPVQAQRGAPALRPVRLERGTSGVKPNEDRVVFRGSLGLDSRPQGARVFVNGLDVGRTPIDLKNLAVGSRAVQLELAGYQTWSSVIRVVTNQRSRMTADLRPAPTERAPTFSGNDTSPVAFGETDTP